MINHATDIVDLSRMYAKWIRESVQPLGMLKFSDIISQLPSTKPDERIVNVLWAVYCAEAVIKIFEDAYPNDNRPRAAIDAARLWLKQQTKETADAAADAAYTAVYAATNADAAAYAAHAAANAANAAHAASSAADAAYVAHAAAHAARLAGIPFDASVLKIKAEQDAWMYVKESTASLKFSEIEQVLFSPSSLKLADIITNFPEQPEYTKWIFPEGSKVLYTNIDDRNDMQIVTVVEYTPETKMYEAMYRVKDRDGNIFQVYPEELQSIKSQHASLKFSEISDALITPQGNVIPFNKRAFEVQKLFGLTPVEFQNRFNVPADNALLSRGYIYINGGIIQVGVGGSGLNKDQSDLISQYLNTLPKNTEVELILLKHDINSFKLIEETPVYQGDVQGALDKLLNMPSQTGELTYQQIPGYQFVPQKGGVSKDTPSGTGWKRQFKFKASLTTEGADDYQYRDDYYKSKEHQGQHPRVLYTTSIPDGLLSPDGKFYSAEGKAFGVHNILAMELIKHVPDVYKRLQSLLEVAPKTDNDYFITVSLIALNYLLIRGWVRVNDATQAYYSTEQGSGIAFSGFDTQHVIEVAKKYLDSQPVKFKEVLINIYQPYESENIKEEYAYIVGQYYEYAGRELSSEMQQWLQEHEYAYIPAVVFQGSQEDFMSKYGSNKHINLKFSDMLRGRSKHVSLIQGRTHNSLPVVQMDGRMYAMATDEMADKAIELAHGLSREDVRRISARGRGEYLNVLGFNQRTLDSYYMNINDLPKEVLRSLGVNRGFEGEIYVYELD